MSHVNQKGPLAYFSSKFSFVYFIYARLQTYYGMVMSVRPSGSPSVSHSFPHFSPTCFDILSWNFACHFLLMNTIKFESRQCPSIFVGVMPLLELKILEIHSFPHFSLTCFVTLSWNLAYDFVLLYFESSLSIDNSHQFFVGIIPLFRTKNTEDTQFSTLFSYMLWHIELKFCKWLYLLLCYRSIRVLSICVNFCRSYAPFGT